MVMDKLVTLPALSPHIQLMASHLVGLLWCPPRASLAVPTCFSQTNTPPLQTPFPRIELDKDIFTHRVRY